MLDRKWRKDTWADLDQLWDVIVIGGGITGAGIFNMAAQKGLKVVLLEARDFAFGTSSRSSKLIHGGIRYLKNKQFDVVLESVRERERLIKESDGLVDPMAFIFPAYENNLQEAQMMRLGVIAYDLMASKWQHDFLKPDAVVRNLPAINQTQLVGGVQYYDARLDDSQLVMRVISDGVRFGGLALNYSKVTDLCKSRRGRVEGVVVEDQTGTLSPATQEIRGNVVINATGPWSDELRKSVSSEPKLRRLRGSHLIFSREKLPIEAAVTMLHPRDHRALFAIPWEGQTMVGTTDLDDPTTEDESRIAPLEYEYLMEAAQYAFPDFSVTDADLISSFAGLRPVINTNAPTPSQESRAHQVWEEDGLVTISGGKLTIFRVMAADVLNFCRGHLPGELKFDHQAPCFIHPTPEPNSKASEPEWQMMAGRLGLDVNPFFESAAPNELQAIAPLPQFWAELAWAANNEAVVHLDDLLLRRVRVGLLLPNGGLDEMEHIQKLVQQPLDWSDDTWQAELDRYRTIWQQSYHLPY